MVYSGPMIYSFGVSAICNMIIAPAGEMPAAYCAYPVTVVIRVFGPIVGFQGLVV